MAHKPSKPFTISALFFLHATYDISLFLNLKIFFKCSLKIKIKLFIQQ